MQGPVIGCSSAVIVLCCVLIFTYVFLHIEEDNSTTSLVPEEEEVAPHKIESMLVLVSGPSGSGKSTVINAFLSETPGFARCISVTTRPRRHNEVDGVDYFFVDEEEFKRRVESNDLLEYANMYGHHYGTPKNFVVEHLLGGISLINDVSVEGAQSIKSRLGSTFYDENKSAVQLPVVLVFMAAPSIQVLEDRLRFRNADTEEVIQRRMSEASSEQKHVNLYDYLIINEFVNESVKSLQAIVLAEKLSIQR
ncbi:guanylate kinase [Pelomyxa schiedti]|nr:guanylate kinase [Pelomyxa schiedti]